MSTRRSEPKPLSPGRGRLPAAAVAQAGVRVALHCSPIIPFYPDSSITTLILEKTPAGARTPALASYITGFL